MTRLCYWIKPHLQLCLLLGSMVGSIGIQFLLLTPTNVSFAEGALLISGNWRHVLELTPRFADESAEASEG